MPTNSAPTNRDLGADAFRPLMNPVQNVQQDFREAFRDDIQGFGRGSLSGGDLADRLSFGSGTPFATQAQSAQFQVEGSLAAFLQQAAQLDATNNDRFEGALGRLTGAVDQNSGPSITDEDINRLFASGADRAALGAQGQFSGLRSALGGAGITGGGLAAGLAANVELGRLQSTDTAKRDLRIFKAESDAKKSLENVRTEFALANFASNPADMTLLSAFQDATSLRVFQQGNAEAEEERKRQAKAAKRAGNLAAVGGVASGLIGLL